MKIGICKKLKITIIHLTNMSSTVLLNATRQQSNTSSLTYTQRAILAKTANTLGFTMPILGSGLHNLQLQPEHILNVLLDLQTRQYTVITIYGSNCYDRNKFKAVFNRMKNFLTVNNV